MGEAGVVTANGRDAGSPPLDATLADIGRDGALGKAASNSEPYPILGLCFSSRGDRLSARTATGAEYFKSIASVEG